MVRPSLDIVIVLTRTIFPPNLKFSYVRRDRGAALTNHARSADMCSCGTPAADKNHLVALGLGSLALATPGSRSWFGNFRRTRAKCIVKRGVAVIPRTRN
jgi:hypothetical protein